MSAEILVTGGTGKTGARLVARLREAGHSVRCASRSGKEGVAFDWFEPSGHDAALAGVERAYLVAPVGASRPIESMEPFIERALAMGVQRFVLLSSSLIEEGGPAMGEVHALLRRRAPEWAVLRPSWFMENFTIAPHLTSIREEGCIYSATGDGLVPFIAVDDIAEVALHALTDARAANDDLVLTGPATITYDDVAAILGRQRDEPVRHVRLSVRELAARWEAHGIPAEFAVMLAGLDGAIAAGAEARTTPRVAEWTGRAPVSFADFTAKHAGMWRSTLRAPRASAP